MNSLDEVLDGVKSAAIAGHVNPDGDCIGSCMGLYLYMKDNFPAVHVDVYLEKPGDEFLFIRDIDCVETEYDSGSDYDLMFLLDVSSSDRIGVAASLYECMDNTVCLDHHVTNKGLGRVNRILPKASSTCEVLYEILDDKKISKACAEALYTGIVHDTGVFQYTNTSPATMRAAANLMEKGIPFSDIVDRSFYQKSYAQNQLLGRTLMESILLLDGSCIAGVVRQKEMEFYGLTSRDMDGIVSQLRNTKGVEVAIFLYEKDSCQFKVSLRSKSYVDVSKIASLFGGGGHAKAAGCIMHGTPYDVICNLASQIEIQLKEV